MNKLLSFLLAGVLLMNTLSLPTVQAQSSDMALTNFRLRVAWTQTGSLRAARTSLDFLVPEEMYGESVRLVYEYYDSRREEWRQLKRSIRRLPSRKVLRVRRNLPRTAQGAVDVWVEYRGEQFAFVDDAFVVGQEEETSSADAARPVVTVDEFLREVRRHIREQSMYYVRGAHYDALQSLNNVEEMFKVIGDTDAAIYEKLADIPYKNIFKRGEILKYGDYDVLRLPSFNADNNRLTEQFLNQIVENQSLGAIIDLRGNNYGSVKDAVDALEPFLNTNESMVFTKKNGTGQEVEAMSQALINPFRDVYVDKHHIPIAVLVDGQTSAAAEIFAAAMSEYNVGRIIGSKTSGDTNIRILLKLADGSYLRLTSARWLTGKFGKDLTGQGVSIDKVVTNDPNTPIDEVMEEARKYIYALPTKHFIQRGLGNPSSQ